jgi:hypothetical protein
MFFLLIILQTLLSSICGSSPDSDLIPAFVPEIFIDRIQPEHRLLLLVRNFTPGNKRPFIVTSYHFQRDRFFGHLKPIKELLNSGMEVLLVPFRIVKMCTLDGLQFVDGTTPSVTFGESMDLSNLEIHCEEILQLTKTNQKPREYTSKTFRLADSTEPTFSFSIIQMCASSKIFFVEVDNYGIKCPYCIEIKTDGDEIPAAAHLSSKAHADMYSQSTVWSSHQFLGCKGPCPILHFGRLLIIPSFWYLRQLLTKVIERF